MKLKTKIEKFQKLAFLSRLPIYCLSLSLVVASSTNTLASAETSQFSYDEYHVKGVFIYNFLQFIVSENEKTLKNTNNEARKTITINVVTRRSDVDISRAIQGKLLNGRVIKVVNIAENELFRTEYSTDCEALFICADQTHNFELLMNRFSDKNILIIGESKGFLKKGGAINFLLDKKSNKIRFEINLKAIKKAGFSVNAQLLKLAKRVVTE